jgi:hypothetical protein
MDELTPGMHRVLRQACLYGYLAERNDRLYHPGGSTPVCTRVFISSMVRLGWLKPSFGRYEITSEGKRAEAQSAQTRLPDEGT